MNMTKYITAKTRFASFPGDPEGKCMAFLNGNTFDCRAENLMWFDLSYVQQYLPDQLDTITEEMLNDRIFQDEN